MPSPALREWVARRSIKEVRRQQASRFAELHLFFAEEGRYGGTRFTRTLVRIGRWTRVRIELAFPSEGAPLRIDPCELPALIQIAWIALRRGREVTWSARGPELECLRLGGDVVRLTTVRTLDLRSTGNDPRLFLPNDAIVMPPLRLDCWIRSASAG